MNRSFSVNAGQTEHETNCYVLLIALRQMKCFIITSQKMFSHKQFREQLPTGNLTQQPDTLGICLCCQSPRHEEPTGTIIDWWLQVRCRGATYCIKATATTRWLQCCCGCSLCLIGFQTRLSHTCAGRGEMSSLFTRMSRNSSPWMSWFTCISKNNH